MFQMLSKLSNTDPQRSPSERPFLVAGELGSEDDGEN